MKKSLPVLVLVSLIAFVLTTAAGPFPKPTGYVNDFAKLLTSEQLKSLNTELIDFEKKTMTEISVVTVTSLNGETIENFTRSLATEWKVGKKGLDNGVVFLIAPNERKMRIEKADGVKNLTNAKCDEIRDEVLSSFRAGNMPQGIIDGVHSIMKVISAKPVLAEKSETKVTEVDLKTALTCVAWLFSAIISIVLLLLAISIPVNRAAARKYVLAEKVKVTNKFAQAEKLVESVYYVNERKTQTRDWLAKKKDDFSAISRLKVTSEKVDWHQAQEKLDKVNFELEHIISCLMKDINFAKKAEQDGPKLFLTIPALIKATEGKLAKGKKSKEANRSLAQAREQYRQVQNKCSNTSEMSLADWVMVYLIMDSIQSNTTKAEDAHQYVNSDHSYRSSGSSDDGGSSSGGFGGSDSFGGGGGFSGGGSSGGW